MPDWAIHQISTHTPLARRDWKKIKRTPRREISTHTPLARRDYKPRIDIYIGYQFLLTRLLRGVTIKMGGDEVTFKNFYSHASCEA